MTDDSAVLMEKGFSAFAKMDNSWHRKCGPYLNQPPPPPPLPPSQLASYSQDSVLLTSGMTQEHMVSNIHGLDNMGHADLGASFLSLVSGQSLHVPCGKQHLLDPKPVSATNLHSSNCRNGNGFTGGSRASVLPGALWPCNMDCPNMSSGEAFFVLNSSNADGNCGNSFPLLQSASLNFQKSQAIQCNKIHEENKPKSYYSLIVNKNASPASLNFQKYAHVTSLQTIPVESNVSGYRHGYNHCSSFFRVFCSGISGNLLVSDTGLLGVVCECHGLFMSISKFSEHSGSSDVNPGNAVCMDNGETLATWWKNFYSKTGTGWVLDGQTGWDWPEGISVPSGLRNHPIASMSNNPVLLDQVGPFKASVSYEQQNYSLINSKENQSRKNVVDKHLYHERNKTSLESSNSILKYLTNSSHSGQHICGLPNSFRAQASQSTTDKLDPICESANSFPVLPGIQGLGVGRKTSFSGKRPRVSSNIELRLGQPPEQSQALETKVKHVFVSDLNGMHAEASEVCFTDKLLQKTSNELQGRVWTVQYADITSNPTERRGSTLLDHSCNVGGAYGAKTESQKDSSNVSLEMTDVNSLLLSCLKTPATKWEFSNVNDNSSDIHVSKKLHYESHSYGSENVPLPWTSLAANDMEFVMHVSNTQIDVNKGPEVECSLNGLLGLAKSNTEFSKAFKEDQSSFSLVHEKSLNSQQMPAMIAAESYGRDILDNCPKTSSVSDVMHFNHDHIKPIHNSIVSRGTIPLGFSSSNSGFARNVTPTLSKVKPGGTKDRLQHENVEIPVVWKMLEMSDRDNCPDSRSLQDSEIIKNPCAQSLTIAPSISKNCKNLLDPLRMPKIPEIREKPTLPGTICCVGHNSERFGTVTGRSMHTEDPSLPPVERPVVRSGGTNSNFTESKKEHCFQGLPYAYVPEKRSSSAQENSSVAKYSLNGDNCCNLIKQGNKIGAATSLLHPKLNGNGIFLKETTKSFGNTESLVATNSWSTESCAFQWRDVPKKIMESCSSSRKEQQAGSCYQSLGSPASDVAKRFAGFAQNIVPLKEQDMSNISSGCSALDVTQSSIEVNKNDSSTIEGGCIRCVNSLFLDEGSGNDRSWSPDDALDNEFCAEFFGSSSSVNVIKREPSNVVSRKRSLSLIEEIRPQNSLRSTNSPHNMNISSNIQEESNCLQNSAIAAAKGTSQNLQNFYHQGEQLTTKAHKGLPTDDTLREYAAFRNKRLQFDDASTLRKGIQETCYNSVELTAELISLGGGSNSLGKPNFYKGVERPIVYGKYGIISNGNPSKPTKIVPLWEILRTAAPHSDKSSRSTADDEKLKFRAVKMKKANVRHIKDTALGWKVLGSRGKKGGTHNSQPIGPECCDRNWDIETASCSATNGSDDLIYTSHKCDNHGITERKPWVQMKTKFRDGKMRSLHEILSKASRCCGELMEEAVDGRAQTNKMNSSMRCSEKHQPEKSDMFHFVCGGSDKDEYNQLLQCSRFLIKKMNTDSKGIPLSKAVTPNSDCKRLQPGETFLTCARTEGYKGRKGEGVLHNHPQDTDGNGSCLVPQEQLNAWFHIHRQKPQRKGHPKLSCSNVESDCKRAYAQYKQSKSWKQLVVYKSGIHALGLYTSHLILHGAMVVEYVGEIVGLRVADRRESEYHSGRRIQHKGACYFFRIDKEHIIDATRKGGIARFVNHSCQPNCVAKVISVRTEKKVVFLAGRDIYPGEEITYDYHFSHEEGEKIPCLCKSKNCRRYLN